MSKTKITSGLEDYIEVISNRLKIYNKVRPIDISKELGVTRASVSEALKRLNEQKLINYDRYGEISITEKGEKTAASVIKRHKLLEKFFCEILGLDKSEAAENACKIEHVISDNFINRLTAFVEFTEKNPQIKKDFQNFRNSV